MRKPRKPWPSFYEVLIVTGLPFFILRILPLSFEKSPNFQLAVRIQLALTVVFAAIFLVRELRLRRRSFVDEALTERPEGLVEYPAEVTIFANHVLIGVDRGVVYFEQGLFGFVGSSFSYLLAASDFVDCREIPLAQREFMSPKLTLRVPEGKPHLSVKPLFGYGRSYRASLRQFFEENGPLVAERQWPPLQRCRAADKTYFVANEEASKPAQEPEVAPTSEVLHLEVGDR